MKNSRRMLLGVLVATAALFFIAGTALAQDVAKVAGGPETHKLLFEDAHARVFDVRLKPGQKVAMHSHPPSVIYFATDSKFKFTSPDGKTQVSEAKAGTAFWRDAVTHAVENAGTAEIHLVHVELKGTAPPAKQ